MAIKKKELAAFKQRLEEIKRKIELALKGASEEVKKPDEATGYSQHQADQGTDDFDKTINIEVTSKEYDILRQVERALEKIEENTYGVCDVTGDAIPLARLEAVPYAVMTVKAQEMHEKGMI